MVSGVRTVPEFKLHPICGTVSFTSLLFISEILTNDSGAKAAGTDLADL